MSLTDPETSTRLWTLQLVEDAIGFRQNQLSLPCADCSESRPCSLHADDERLIASYQQHEQNVFSEVFAQADPADAQWARQLDETPAVSALSAMIRASWRETLADGPAIVEFDDGQPVVLVPVDGGRRFVEYVPDPDEVAALLSLLNCHHPDGAAPHPPGPEDQALPAPAHVTAADSTEATAREPERS